MPFTERLDLMEPRLVTETDFGQVKGGPERVLGSDKNLSLVMNFSNEREGIERCLSNLRDQNPNVSLEEQREMATDYLRLQWRFYLSEFGCGKFLAIQPPHFFEIWHEGGELSVTPLGLRQFGDHARRYIDNDPVVGDGLVYGYSQLAQMGKGGALAVMSPTELYQKYGSTTDVLDLMGVFEGEEGISKAFGQYIVLGQVLSREERRFIYNYVAAADDVKHDPWQVKTDGLNNFGGEVGVEHLQLVRRPSLFKDESATQSRDWYESAVKLDQAFKTRFGRLLFEVADLEMYPIIDDLVRLYAPRLSEAILDQPSEERYYDGLRRMVYECQSLWMQVSLQNQGKLLIEEDWRVAQYLDSLTLGCVVVGFEVGFGGDSFSWGHEYWDFNHPWGVEQQYCRTHHRNYEGNGCPECEKKERKIR